MIPSETQAALLEEQSGRLKIKTIPLPAPGPGQVLVKMDHAPVNFSDLGLIDGRYPATSLPLVPGFEGSGTVVAAGKGILPRMRMNKRVACSPEPGKNGTWAIHMLTSAARVVPLDRSITMQQGSMLLVNPMSAMALMDIALKKGHRAMINNAAASNLGRMLFGLASENGIPMINIVRKESSVLELRELGAEHILLSTDADFHDELAMLASELDASLLLDAVCGKESLDLLKAAPDGSTMISYARLAGTEMHTDPADLINRGKNIEGFQLGRYLATLGLSGKLSLIRKVKRNLATTLSSRIREIHDLKDVQEAVEKYREQMSGGKILLKL